MKELARSLFLQLPCSDLLIMAEKLVKIKQFRSEVSPEPESLHYLSWVTNELDTVLLTYGLSCNFANCCACLEAISNNNLDIGLSDSDWY